MLECRRKPAPGRRARALGHHGIGGEVGVLLQGISSWLGRRVEAGTASLFRLDDERARQHGWQVERGRLGLSRTYRDQRFSLARRDDAQ
jgi:hypothetical protein